MGDTYLFVYGTLRRGAVVPARAALDRHAEFIAHATLNGKLFEVDGYPGAVACAAGNDRVVGEAYRIRDQDALFRALDEYEECSARFPEPHEYVRAMHPVMLEDGIVVRAWVYLYTRPAEALCRIESGDYRASQAVR
ncbi:gamma-glutamylcyclotransferase family protein [Solimonas flava]|uniref:gamma-glutamylcyclotransferase family protein n=1 Tax=Solimonas flava TaxID=415849 RepID=UPI000423A766|nr:gamma-glutamylcyclotransferase family protein [Solimonas flava]